MSQPSIRHRARLLALLAALLAFVAALLGFLRSGEIPIALLAAGLVLLALGLAGRSDERGDR